MISKKHFKFYFRQQTNQLQQYTLSHQKQIKTHNQTMIYLDPKNINQNHIKR